MPTLGDIAKLIRSKNAGPFYLTFDIMFENEANYALACASPALSVANIAQLYGIPEQTIEVYHYTPAYAIKITFPRKIPSCDVGDTDGHGGQQFAPMVDLVL